jgi:hypothetical protein
MVVDAAPGERRAALVALAGVVVDHVEDHLDAGGVQALDHALELAHRVGAAVARLGGEEADRVVAPVVDHPALDQRAVVDERVHRQQLERGHAQRLQVVDHLRRAHPLVGALQVRGHVRVQPRIAVHVHLVDHAVVGHEVRVAVLAPVERGVDHLRARHAGGVVALVERQVVLLVADGVAEVRVAPLHAPDDAARIGVDQQLVRIEAVPLLRLVGPVHAIAVELAGAQLRQVAVPDEIGALAQRDALHLALAGLLEQAQLDLLGVAREQREIHPFAVPGRAERMRGTRPDLGHVLRHRLVSHSLTISSRPRRGISTQSGRLAIS